MSVQQHLLGDLQVLCDPKLDGRAPGSAGHKRVQEFLRQQLVELEFEPLFGESHDQVVEDRGREVGRNICGQWAGSTGRTILIGAHYDHFKGMQGADDNAAALAIMLEAARQLRPWRGQSRLAFCFFDLEEPPHFHGPTMGSNYFVRNCPLNPP